MEVNKRDCINITLMNCISTKQLSCEQLSELLNIEIPDIIMGVIHALMLLLV